MVKKLNETASAGSTGAGSIAVVQSRLGDMRTRQSLKGFLARFHKNVNRPFKMKEVTPYFTGIKEAYIINEAYDLSDVVSQLKGLENSDQKHENTVTYGVEDDNGNIMKISVKKDQAKDFEYRLATEMAQAKDDNLTGKTAKLGLAELLYNLKDEFNIVDVEFPKIPKDVIYNADKATRAPAGQGMNAGENDQVDDMNPDQGMEGEDQDLQGGEGGEGFDENGEPLQGAEGGMEGGEEGEMGDEDLEAPEGDDESVEDFGEDETGSSPENILNAVMSMLKSQADAEKAKADAAAEESRAKQAEYAYKTAQSTVAHEEEFAQMEVEADAQKQKQKDAKRLADLAKAKVQKASSFKESTSILGQVIQEFAQEFASEDEEKRVRPLFVDDWNVYGKDNAGKWYYVISEMWPDWYDIGKDPEGMNVKDFANTIKEIYHKRGGSFYSVWRPVKPEYVRSLEDSYNKKKSEGSDSLLESVLNELDDGMDTEQSINRAKVDLRMRWRPMPGDTPDTIAYKTQMLRDGNMELDTKLKAIKTRNMYNVAQAKKQAALQVQQNQNQNGQNGNQTQPNGAPNQTMNPGM